MVTPNPLHESVLLEIAARGHPSLRTLNTCTDFTFAGFRQITAALPQLTGISITSIETAGHDDVLVDFSRGLESLEINVFGLPSGLEDAIFDSVAAYCRNLRTFAALGLTVRSRAKLNAILESCAALRVCRADDCPGLSIPPNRPGLVVLYNKATASTAEQLA